MIRAQSLTRKYGDFEAVKDVSFEINQGEIVGLLGHNGAGKTTIMKMLTGYLEPSTGTINIDNLDLASDRAAIQASIGYLPENCPLYPEMLVLDYLDYAATLRAVPENAKCERVAYAIEKTNLAGVVQKPISKLSRGYRQRLGVAQAILNSPSILILDEPTNGLDPRQILEMRALIKELSQGSTILLSTHIMQEVSAVCDRVIVINRGRLALDAKLASLQNSRKLVLCTDANETKLSHLFSNNKLINTISRQNESDDKCTYVLEISSDDCSSAIAEIAKQVVENNFKIFEIKPQVRDLETVFREITVAKQDSVESTKEEAGEADTGSEIVLTAASSKEGAAE